MASNDRMRLTINFRERDKELYDYIINKSEIIGVSSAIKLLIKESMEKEKTEKEGN